MRLRVSAEALADLTELRAYGIQTYGERAADAYIATLGRTLERIAEWPLASRLRTEIRPPVRLIVHEAHNIFFDVEDDVVEIVRVLHHTIDWQNRL